MQPAVSAVKTSRSEPHEASAASFPRGLARGARSHGGTRGGETPERPVEPEAAEAFAVRPGLASRRRRLVSVALLLGVMVPVVLVRLSWANPTAAEAEYRRLAAVSLLEGNVAGQPIASADVYDHAVALVTPASQGPRGVQGAWAQGENTLEALWAGRWISRLAGVLSVLVGAWWAFEVARWGRPGRGMAALLGVGVIDASAPGVDGQPLRVAEAGPSRVPPLLAAVLASLALGFCLPLVHHSVVLGPAAAATASLLVAAAAAWHATCGRRNRLSGWLPGAAALAFGLLAWILEPRLALPLAALAAWAIATALLRLRQESDPLRRFRNATSALMGGLLALTVVLWWLYRGGGAPSAAPGFSALAWLPETVAAAPGVERLLEPGRLFADRLGWLAWASPLAFAVSLWVRPAAGALLALLVVVILLGAGWLVSPAESDLLPAYVLTLLAWSLAAAAGLRAIHGPASAVGQAVAERLGFFQTAIPVGRILAMAALAALVAWGAYRSPAYFLTAAVAAEGTQRGPYGRTDWARATPALAEALRAAEVVATSAPAAARFHLGRADVLLSQERLSLALAAGLGGSRLPEEGEDGGFAVLDSAAGLPVVASLEGIRSLFREKPAGLIVVDRSGWRRPAGVPVPVADEIERRTRPIALPARAGLYAFFWQSEEVDFLGSGVNHPMGLAGAEAPRPVRGQAGRFSEVDVSNDR